MVLRSALQSIAGASGVGIPVAARRIRRSYWRICFALEVQGVEWHIFMNVLV